MADFARRELLGMLDLAVLKKSDCDTWHFVDTPPSWVEQVFPGATQDESFVPGYWSPFLETFLLNAEETTAAGKGLRLTSGPWVERVGGKEEVTLNATYLVSQGHPFALVERLGSDYDEMRQVLQTAREISLKSVTLRQSRDDLSLFLDLVAVGVVTTDAKGRCTFLNQQARLTLGAGDADLTGKPWQELKIFDSTARRIVEALMELPQRERSRTPLEWEREDGRVFWMETDVLDDPRDTRRKLIVLYDVSELHDLRRLLDSQSCFENLVGKSKEMRRLYQAIQNLAGVDTPVLIEGETGTGKELVARALHVRSPRSRGPYVALNCAGLTEALVASQLFGYKRGAFTGALEDRRGVFEAANGGVLFLDEIGDIPLTVQASLLRVLQEREITRLGETHTRKVDVRIVAATHRSLADEVQKGNFRADLLYRIRIARLALPPLRERREDIPLLASRFLSDFRAATGKSVLGISASAMSMLMKYHWPGNVRELRGAIEFATVNAARPILLPTDLPPEVPGPRRTGISQVLHADSPPDERESILTALRRANGNRSVAAQMLGISRATFYRRLAELGNRPGD